MKSSNKNVISLVLALVGLFAVPAFADGNFEIVDGSANISGKPATGLDEARDNWDRACTKWKNETKELNKNDQVMLLSCDSPSCSFSSDIGKNVCSSTAQFKVKTAGTRVDTVEQPVAPAPVVTTEVEPAKEVIVEQAPPQVIYEPVPAPRPGFLWVAGFWGWSGGHHHWNAGYWRRSRPGYSWSNPTWRHASNGWKFQTGHWRR